MDDDEFSALLIEGAEAAKKVPPATTLMMNEEGMCVELYIDNKTSDYSEWIPGEGADIGLMRDLETNRVVGVRLPMRYTKLIVGRIPAAP